MITRQPDIEAYIRFLTTAEGGRRSDARTGYRASHNFGDAGQFYEAQHEYPDYEIVPLGETVLARIWFFAPEFQEGQLAQGDLFTIHERGLVGKGRIAKVLCEAMHRARVPA